MVAPVTPSGPQPVFVSTDAPGGMTDPTACEPKSTTGGVSVGTGGRSLMYTLIVLIGAPATSACAFE